VRERDELAGHPGKTCANRSKMGGLGFRDIELFNLALVVRQGWRMLMNPGSLSTKVLKAVYFPGTTLLNTNLSWHMSQIWRAIHRGLKVLKQGIV
jgi:hypothetical protein